MKKRLLATVAGAACLLNVSVASALTFTATGTGPITAYFYGESASFGSDIGLWINGVAQGVYGLQNHTTAPGTPLVLGSAVAGDILVFELRVSTGDYYGPGPVDYSLFSNPLWNADLSEHVSAWGFAGGPYSIPAGTLVGFEDIIPLSGSDFDYDDHLFVFTGVRSEQVPDGGLTLALLGASLGGLGLLRRKV